MSEGLPPVPGVHSRTCPGCGTGAVITAETSREVKRGELVETREHDCGGCGRTFRIRIPAWRCDPTEEDVSILGEWARRRRQAALVARREKEMAAERENGTNG